MSEYYWLEQRALGYELDDLAEEAESDCAPDCDERTSCPLVGGAGHFQCGTCREHNEPRHHCGCIVLTREAAK